MHVTSSMPQRFLGESPIVPPSNAEVAALLERVGALLVAQRASLDRARAWSVAASLLRAREQQVRDLHHTRRVDQLLSTLGVSPRVASAIDEIVRTRGLALLARLEGDLGPDPISAPSSVVQPPVALLLQVDAQYRSRAAADELTCVAPRRFNPEHEAWLPVLHVEAGGWLFSAMNSNTALAHRLGVARDWVVIFAEREGVETQHVMLTERRGLLAGRRVVRAREMETAALSSAPA